MKRWKAFPWIVLLLTGAMAAASPQDDPKVDLNSATADQLQALPGIGPALAKRIVEFREKNGPFQKAEDLMNVPGIGEKKFLQLKDRILVKPPAGNAKPKEPSAK